MFRLVLALVLAAGPLMANAQSGAEIRKQAQASMLVTGSIDIERDGSVSSYTLDKQDKLPGYVVDAIGKAVPGWQFEPVMVDGAPVPALARMTLRLLAVQADQGVFEISISSATFGGIDSEDTDYPRSIRLTPPEYPYYALERDASGDVYLLLKVGRDGRVEDVAVEQVNLRGVADARTMDKLRKHFSEASLAVTRRWKFTPPSTGDDVDAPFWSVRVPISFVMWGTSSSDKYGTWIAYVPGPRQTATWREGKDSNANDAIVSGTVQLADAGPRLLTPLQPES
jgi:hypothetical protein